MDLPLWIKLFFTFGAVALTGATIGLVTVANPAKLNAATAVAYPGAAGAITTLLLALWGVL